MKPIYLAEYGMYVPCRRCRLCKIAKASEWALRVIHELKYYEGSVFITLTYDDDNVPIDKSLKKRDLQLFIKRLREEVGGRRIKYLACGEYGELGKRPHYHLIVFGVTIEEHQVRPVKYGSVDKGFKCLEGPVFNAWKNGFIVLGSVTKDSALYVMGYAQKAYNGELIKKVYLGKENPFQLQSQGIGLRYALEKKDVFVEDLATTIGGVRVGLPMYYQKKLLGEKEKRRLVARAIDKEGELVTKYLKRGEKEKDISGLIKRSRWQNGLSRCRGIDLKKRPL